MATADDDAERSDEEEWRMPTADDDAERSDEEEWRMPKGIIYLETRPVSPDREAEYHTWYNDTHLAEICSVDGIVSARRFAPTDGNGPFIAIYELDCDDLDGVVQRLGELGASGKMSSLELLNMETPPIPKVYRQIGSYPK